MTRMMRWKIGSFVISFGYCFRDSKTDSAYKSLSKIIGDVFNVVCFMCKIGVAKVYRTMLKVNLESMVGSYLKMRKHE